MLLRRLILSAMLIALACCALAGIAVAFLSKPEGIYAVIGAGIATAIATGLLLPLTFLVDRPHFRLAGITGMIVVTLMLQSILCICAANALSVPAFSGPRQLDEIGFDIFIAALCFGIPTAAAMMLVKFRWARIAPPFLAVVATLCFVMVVTSLFFNNYPNRFSDNLIASSAITFGFGILAAILLINVRCGDRRYFRFPAIFIIFALWVMVMIRLEQFMRFPDIRSYEPWDLSDLAAGLFAVSVFYAHLNLLLMIPRRAQKPVLMITTITLSAVCGIFAFLAEVNGSYTMTNISTAAGIASGCGSLAMVVFALSHRRFDFRATADRTLLTQIQLTCPRCAKAQTLPLGNSDCIQCGLHLSIQATEPQCMECGYLLYGIAAPRCPECGAANPAGPLPATPSAA